MRIEHWFYALPLRLRSLFHRQRVEQDLDEELQYHLEQKTEEYIAQGLTPTQSRHAAVRAMDGLTQRKEERCDARGVNAIESAVQDIRYSVRVLRKSPAFTIAAVLTLALAIGANAVVFGVLNAVVLRRLNVPHAESLWGTEYGADQGFQSYPNYLDLRDRNRSFDDLAAFNFAQIGLDTGKDPSFLWGYAATGNYFDVLGVQPYLGRFFHVSDEHGENSAPYIVLTYAYWHAQFLDDRSVVGRVVRLNKHPFTIIGVAPPDFRGTLSGIFGMAAYSVNKRLKELGIRMALGAQRQEMLQTALGRPFQILIWGSAAGLVLGLLAARVLAFIVYQATPRDPLVLAGVVLAMSLLGLLATWIPAQRALSLDPVALLREE